MAKKRAKPKAMRWIARYGCGCTADAERKRDLLEYCGQHGHDREELLKLPRVRVTETKGGGRG